MGNWAKWADLRVPQMWANGNAMVFPAALRLMGRFRMVVGAVAVALLVAVVAWAFTG